jgi:hypothetical protein
MKISNNNRKSTLKSYHKILFWLFLGILLGVLAFKSISLAAMLVTLYIAYFADLKKSHKLMLTGGFIILSYIILANDVIYFIIFILLSSYLLDFLDLKSFSVFEYRAFKFLICLKASLIFLIHYLGITFKDSIYYEGIIFQFNINVLNFNIVQLYDLSGNTIHIGFQLFNSLIHKIIPSFLFLKELNILYISLIAYIFYRLITHHIGQREGKLTFWFILISGSLFFYQNMFLKDIFVAALASVLFYLIINKNVASLSFLTVFILLLITRSYVALSMGLIALIWLVKQDLKKLWLVLIVPFLLLLSPIRDIFMDLYYYLMRIFSDTSNIFGVVKILVITFLQAFFSPTLDNMFQISLLNHLLFIDSVIFSVLFVFLILFVLYLYWNKYNTRFDNYMLLSFIMLLIPIALFSFHRVYFAQGQYIDLQRKGVVLIPFMYYFASRFILSILNKKGTPTGTK